MTIPTKPQFGAGVPRWIKSATEAHLEAQAKAEEVQRQNEEFARQVRIDEYIAQSNLLAKAVRDNLSDVSASFVVAEDADKLQHATFNGGIHAVMQLDGGYLLYFREEGLFAPRRIDSVTGRKERDYRRFALAAPNEEAAELDNDQYDTIIWTGFENLTLLSLGKALAVIAERRAIVAEQVAWIKKSMIDLETFKVAGRAEGQRQRDKGNRYLNQDESGRTLSTLLHEKAKGFNVTKRDLMVQAFKDEADSAFDPDCVRMPGNLD